ncbi:MAG: hypothetical protein L6V90_07605 [Treponema succinifaciens]|nr:MAG: hypothetical protein L6V90_07605 [Treponema succinifaciens]
MIKKDYEKENPSTQTFSEISSGSEVASSQEISSTSLEKNNSSDSSADELFKKPRRNISIQKNTKIHLPVLKVSLKKQTQELMKDFFFRLKFSNQIHQKEI